MWRWRFDSTDGCADSTGCTICDDGNTTSGDGCSATCEVEAGWSCTLTTGAITTCAEVCGDSLVVGDEVCDDGNNATEVMPYGQLSCNNGNCKAGCRESGCTLSYCGDDITQSANGEECDDGSVANSNTTPDACRANCKSAFCGDGVQDTAEACDSSSGYPFTPTYTCPGGLTYDDASCSFCQEGTYYSIGEYWWLLW